MKKTILIAFFAAGLALTGCVQQTPAQNQNVNQSTVNADQNINQPIENQNINQPAPTGQTTSVTENAAGIIKLVYSKSGKNYLDIDYIELNPNWVPGGMSEKPAYQNNNPKIRTFEISPDAKFIIGAPRVSITFSEFQNIFSPSNTSSTSYQKGNPWDIVIIDGVVTNVTEHFIP